jgi:hypothetical protein
VDPQIAREVGRSNFANPKAAVRSAAPNFQESNPELFYSALVNSIGATVDMAGDADLWYLRGTIFAHESHFQTAKKRGQTMVTATRTAADTLADDAEERLKKRVGLTQTQQQELEIQLQREKIVKLKKFQQKNPHLFTEAGSLIQRFGQQRVNIHKSGLFLDGVIDVETVLTRQQEGNYHDKDVQKEDGDQIPQPGEIPISPNTTRQTLVEFITDKTKFSDDVMRRLQASGNSEFVDYLNYLSKTSSKPNIYQSYAGLVCNSYLREAFRIKRPFPHIDIQSIASANHDILDSLRGKPQDEQTKLAQQYTDDQMNKMHAGNPALHELWNLSSLFVLGNNHMLGLEKTTSSYP